MHSILKARDAAVLVLSPRSVIGREVIVSVRESVSKSPEAEDHAQDRIEENIAIFECLA